MSDFLAGEVILIDKPLGWTSFDVVKKLKNLIRKQLGLRKIKIGHAGTLDPLASGLLIVCTGKKTKIIESIQALEKEYTGIIQLGATTPSFDLETEVMNEKPFHHLTETEIKNTAIDMTGEVDQLPPIFSAKKVNGKRAYEYARAGNIPELKTKRVSIRSFEINQIDLPVVHFRIACSKGTYIRSIANDFGQNLEVGAYLKALRRTKIGAYDVEKAFQIEELPVFVAQS